MKRSANTWAFLDRRSGVGARGGPRAILPWRTLQGEGARRLFPPLDHALIKVVACEPGAKTRQPLSRQSLADVTARARPILDQPLIGARCDGFRVLLPSSRGGTRTGSFRVLPLAEKVGPVLDRSAGLWQGQPLGARGHPQGRREDLRSGPPPSRTQTSAVVPCHIAPRGTCAAGTSWGGMHRRRAAHRLTAWSIRGWRKSPIAPVHAG